MTKTYMEVTDEEGRGKGGREQEGANITGGQMMRGKRNKNSMGE